MPIKGYNFPPMMFLMELDTQCNFAKVSYERLRNAAPSWYAAATPDDFATAMAPRDIMINCTAFLSAAGVIAKILFEGSRRGGVARRCARLRQLLEIHDLPELRNLSVRNSFEHIDERFDEHFSFFERGKVNSLSVTEKPPDEGTLVLKRFDPRQLTVSFANAKLSLTESVTEIEGLESKINPAFKKLAGAKYDLWAA